MAKDLKLYEQAVTICEEYLGPAGERFLQRQIHTHLHIEPENLKQKDIYALVDWACLSFALLTDDPAEVESFAESLLLLTSTPKNKRLHGAAA